MSAKRAATTVLMGSAFAFGLGALWWWALLGMSTAVGTAAGVTTGVLVGAGIIVSI